VEFVAGRTRIEGDVIEEDLGCAVSVRLSLARSTVMGGITARFFSPVCGASCGFLWGDKESCVFVRFMILRARTGAGVAGSWEDEEDVGCWKMGGWREVLLLTDAYISGRLLSGFVSYLASRVVPTMPISRNGNFLRGRDSEVDRW